MSESRPQGAPAPLGDRGAGPSVAAGTLRLDPGLEGLVALALVAASLCLVLHHVASDSATTDEPVHLTAAAEIVREGTWRWNPEHPPLAKALAGLALSALPLEPPRSPFSGPHIASIQAFLYENAVPAERILFAGRLPFAFLLGLLLLAVRAEARRRFGPVAGLLALALAAFEPNLVAHAGVVHTDVAVTLFLVASLGPLAAVAREKGRRATILLGLLWGLAFLSKYSAPLLVVATLPLLLLEKREVSRGRLLERIALAGGLALVVTLLGFAAAARNQSAQDRDALARERLETMGGSPASARLAIGVGRVFPPAENLLTGALSIALQSRVGAGANFFLGSVREGGSPFYFPVALAVKISLGLALASILAAGTGPGRRILAFVGVAFLVFLIPSVRSSYNIGVRHVLFVFPLLAIAASSAALASGRLRAAAAVLCVVQAGETLLVHPHELAFFNALAGGPEGGRRFFVDSNLDWGQDLVRLSRVARSYSPEAPLPTVFFGGDSPRRYLPSLRGPAPGDERQARVLAVGEQPLAIGPEILASKGARRDAALLDALRRALRERGRRVGGVGGSIGIWELRPPASAEQKP